MRRINSGELAVQLGALAVAVEPVIRKIVRFPAEGRRMHLQIVLQQQLQRLCARIKSRIFK